MPWLRGKRFVFKQDGARPHTGNNTVADMEAAGTGDRWTVKFVTQPAQSPDFNVNDLGFFRSLKSRIKKMKSYCTDREEFIELVKNAYDEYPVHTFDSICGSLYNVLEKGKQMKFVLAEPRVVGRGTINVSSVCCLLSVSSEKYTGNGPPLGDFNNSSNTHK